MVVFGQKLFHEGYSAVSSKTDQTNEAGAETLVEPYMGRITSLRSTILVVRPESGGQVSIVAGIDVHTALETSIVTNVVMQRHFNRRFLDGTMNATGYCTRSTLSSSPHWVISGSNLRMG